MEETQPTTDVPTQIFEKFIHGLMEAEIPEDVVASLRITILEKRNITEPAISQAMFPPKLRK